MALRDVTGDGTLDLLLEHGGAAWLARGNGDGSFAAEAQAVSTGYVPDFVLADMNGDNAVDLLFASGTTIRIMQNSGTGTFAMPQSVATPGTVSDFVAADVNADGKLDLVSLDGPAHTLAVMINQGSTFTAGQTYSSTTGTAASTHLAAGDLTGDGAIDVVVTSNSASTVTTLVNNGTGAFGSPVAYTTGFYPTLVRVVDLNNDGKPDVVAASDSTTTANGSVSVLLNQGSGALGPVTAYVLGEYPTTTPAELAVADINGDGNLDLVAGELGIYSARVLLGNGAGQLTVVDVPLDSDIRAVATGDMNKDGHTDIVFSMSQSPWIVPALGTGTADLFELPHAEHFGSALSVGGGRAIDVNGDGLLDLIGVAEFQRVRTRLATAPAQFATTQSVVMGAYDGQGTGLADFNNDGRTDLFLLGRTPAYGSTGAQTFINDGLGGLTPRTAMPLPALPSRFAFGDLDGDGIRDVVTLETSSSGTGSTVRLARGLGNGDFATPTQLWTGYIAAGIAIADVDKDGKLDVLIDGATGQTATAELYVLAGLGNATFAPVFTAASVPSGRFALRDLDQDGRLDLISWGDGLDVQLGTGGFSFGAPIHVLDYATAIPFEVVFGDLNGDGKLDAVAGTGQESFWILMGAGDGSFTSSGPFYGPNYSGALSLVDLDGDGRLDLVMSYGDYASFVMGRCI